MQGQEIDAGSEDGKTYAVVADPRETIISIDENVDGILCTGDVLDLAPPPDDAPDGSIYAEVNGDEGYASGDVEAILQNIADMTDSVSDRATVRYDSFLDTLDEPFYSVMGNQDMPDAYQDVALRDLDELDEIHGIDGFVPEFSELPEGVFPAGISEESFYEQVRGASGDILLSHSLPSSFEPEQYGFDHAFCSPNEADGSYDSDNVTELPAYRQASEYKLIHV